MTDNNSKPELLPCPFCGSLDLCIIQEYHDCSVKGLWMVKCRGCKLHKGYAEEKQDVIPDWNTRADLCAKDVGVCKDCTDFGCNTCLPETPTPTEAIRNESAETFHTQDHVKRAEALSKLEWLYQKFKLKISPRSRIEINQALNIFSQAAPDHIPEAGKLVDKQVIFNMARGAAASAMNDHEGRLNSLSFAKRFAGAFMVRYAKSTTDHTELLREALEALEIAIGYTALVADGVGKMPIIKDRAKSDCEIIGSALDKINAVLGK